MHAPAQMRRHCSQCTLQGVFTNFVAGHQLAFVAQLSVQFDTVQSAHHGVTCAATILPGSTTMGHLNPALGIPLGILGPTVALATLTT